MNDSFKKSMEAEGYTNLKEINGVICCIQRFAFTTAIVVGLEAYGYKYRYCYPNHSEAKPSLDKWNDINEHPSGNWIKRKGEGGDLTNPNYEVD